MEYCPKDASGTNVETRRTRIEIPHFAGDSWIDGSYGDGKLKELTCC